MGANTPQETAAEFGLLLSADGWQVSTDVDSAAARVEGIRDDAAVMVTHKVRRRPRRFYVLRPAGWGMPGWHEVGRAVFEYFVGHLDLPPGIRGKRIRSACHCGKFRYPTEQRAARGLLNVKVQRALAGEGRAERRAECRAYRCDDDQRVWHLTSRAHWHAATPASERPLSPVPTTDRSDGA